MKQMKTKRLTALTLAFLMLVAMIASCSDAGNSEPDVTSAETTAAVTEAVRAHKLPSLNFDGEQFNTAYPLWQGYEFYFFAEEQNGDIMNDSIYQRAMTVEETLNVKITQENCGYIDDVVSKVKTSVTANDDVYDQALLHCISGVADLSSNGFLYNLDQMPNVDFSADWWNQEQMDVLRLGNNTYYAISDFMIPCPYVIFFNKSMVTDYNMDDPYQLVYSGNWTLDTFSAMARNVIKDVNGDGKMNFDDQYGVTCNEISKYISFMSGANQFITQKNDEGRIEMALNTEKTIHIVELFYNIRNDGVCYRPASMDEKDSLSINTGRILFRLETIAAATNMRDFEVDFGFLPYPKYDEAQENYRSQDWGGLCCVPSTVSNPDMVGAVLELLAFESENTVIPTYYDVVLEGKLARDEDSIAMMDILFDTICYEVGGNYFGFSSGFSDLFYTIGRLCIENGKNDFASWYKKNESAAVTTIDNFYTALEKTEG